MPYENTVGADFWIYKGWENGCKNMNIDFRILLSKHDFYESVNTYKPDILFIYSKFGFRGKDLEKKIKHLNYFFKKKIKIFLAVDWFPSDHLEKTSERDIEIFKNEEICNFYFGEREEESMLDFELKTFRKYIKIPNCADGRYHYPTKKYDKYSYDIVFLGAKLPKKKYFIDEILLPLKEKYNVGIFGPYWSLLDNFKRGLAKISRTLHLEKINKTINNSRISISYEDENKLYSSAKICLNYHEKENNNEHYHQILNQRSFKIPACGGFQIIDKLNYLDRYYSEEEMVSCSSKEDWFEKIDFFLKNEKLRKQFSIKARERTHKDHLYENRISKILKLSDKI